MAATSGSSTPQLHPEPWEWMKKRCTCMLRSFHSYSENWLLFLLHAQFFPGENWILHYEYISYIHLPLCKCQFCFFVIRFPRPFQNWTLFSFSSQKASFWKCWGYSPSVCSSWADVLQKQSFFKGIHPHPGTEGCRKNSPALLWGDDIPRPWIQVLEGKKTNSAGCRGAGWSRWKSTYQEQDNLTGTVGSSCPWLAQGSKPNHSTDSKLGVSSFACCLQMETWEYEDIAGLYRMLFVCVLTMWTPSMEPLRCFEQTAYKLSFHWCWWGQVACWVFRQREESRFQNALGPVFCIVLKLDFSCCVSFTICIRAF